MNVTEKEHIIKILNLTQELKTEIEKGKIISGDIDVKDFKLDTYLDSLLNNEYSDLIDSDIEEDRRNIACYLSGTQLKDLVISIIIALCVNDVIHIEDIVAAIDALNDK